MESTQQDEELPATVEELEAWTRDASPAAVEAQASWWLRSLAIEQVAVAQLDAREDAELALVRSHYTAQRTPHTDRAASLERCLETVAGLASFAKGRKSLALAWGTIGRRTVPARIAVVDPVQAVETARQLLPSAIRVKESVDVRAITPAVMAAQADGVAVDGFELVPEHEKPYATPNNAVASGVAS